MSDIVLGDAMDSMRQIEAGSVALLFTDPPYGHSNGEGDHAHARARWERTRKPTTISGDDTTVEADALLDAMCSQAARVVRPGGWVAVCCGGGGAGNPGQRSQVADWSRIMIAHFASARLLVWFKANGGLLGNAQAYHRTYEFVIIARVGRTITGKGDDRIALPDTILDIAPVPHSRRLHPTEKPEALAARFIGAHTQEGDLVLDPFCGAGSTGVAAVRMGRRFLGIEIDERWARVAQSRMTQVGMFGTTQQEGLDDGGEQGESGAMHQVRGRVLPERGPEEIAAAGSVPGMH